MLMDNLSFSKVCFKVHIGEDTQAHICLQEFVLITLLYQQDRAKGAIEGTANFKPHICKFSPNNCIAYFSLLILHARKPQLPLGMVKTTSKHKISQTISNKPFCARKVSYKISYKQSHKQHVPCDPEKVPTAPSPL